MWIIDNSYSLITKYELIEFWMQWNVMQNWCHDMEINNSATQLIEYSSNIRICFCDAKYDICAFGYLNWSHFHLSDSLKSELN